MYYSQGNERDEGGRKAFYHYSGCRTVGIDTMGNIYRPATGVLLFQDFNLTDPRS